MKLHSIHAGHMTSDGGALFSVIPKTLWSKAYPSDENNIVQLTMRCLLIDLGERKILIEAGVGDHYPEKIKKRNGFKETDALPLSIEKAGYSPNEITDVLFTHLHWDHCNGAVIREKGNMKLQFPHATHWCSKAQWEHSKKSNIRERTAYHREILHFLKEKGDMQLVEKDCELFENVDVRMYDGHTPGQIIPFIKDGKKTYVYMSDFIPTTAHIPIVWLASFDLFPVTSLAEKEEFLREASKKGYILFFEHDYYTECATVKWGEKGPVLKEGFKFK